MSRIAPVTIDGREHYVARVDERVYVDIHHAVDRYGIIAQRRALARLGFAVQIDRGREWWM